MQVNGFHENPPISLAASALLSRVGTVQREVDFDKLKYLFSVDRLLQLPNEVRNLPVLRPQSRQSFRVFQRLRQTSKLETVLECQAYDVGICARRPTIEPA